MNAIPFRVGDDVRVTAPWFAGATGSVHDMVPEVGAVLIELEDYGTRVKRGLILPFAPDELVSVRCQHPQVTEAALWAYVHRRWYDVDPPLCPDCTEWLYPDDQGDETLRIYVGEPRGAGMTR